MAKTDNLTDFMTDLANAIRAKKPNLTGPINAQDFSTEIESISGGTQPTLFEPIVTESLNSITWSTNANNGAFNVTTVGRIDQTEVSSPLTITSAMDGKTLYITSSAEYFNQSQKIVTLKYIDTSIVNFKVTSNIGGNLSATNQIIQFWGKRSAGETQWCPFYNGANVKQDITTTADGTSNVLSSPYSINVPLEQISSGYQEVTRMFLVILDSVFANKQCEFKIFKNGTLVETLNNTLTTGNWNLTSIPNGKIVVGVYGNIQITFTPPTPYAATIGPQNTKWGFEITINNAN